MCKGRFLVSSEFITCNVYMSLAGPFSYRNTVVQECGGIFSEVKQPRSF